MIGQARHSRQASCPQRDIYFTGTNSLVEGQALFYDLDYTDTEAGGLITDPFGKRGKVGVQSTLTDSALFAGVSTANYPVNSHGQIIRINEPPGVCLVAHNMPTVANSTRMTAIRSSSAPIAGRFGHAGLPGRGTALALQTKTSSTSAPLVYGTAGITNVTLNDDSATFSTSGVKAGDTVLLLAGTVPGIVGISIVDYVVSSVIDETNLTLTTSPSSGYGSSLPSGYVIYRNSPMVLAYLFEGQESNGLEYVLPESGAIDISASGATVFVGGHTPSANATADIADGSFTGQRRLFTMSAALGTWETVLSPTSSNALKLDGSGATSFTMGDGAGDALLLEWLGAVDGTGMWRAINAKGVTGA